MARRYERAVRSALGGGRSRGRRARSFFGTALSMNSSREAAPSTVSICDTSASPGPIWRRMKFAPGSRSFRLARLIGIVFLLMGFCNEGLVGWSVHEAVELALVGKPDLDKPGGPLGILVHPARLGGDCRVDFENLARDWRVDFARRLY